MNGSLSFYGGSILAWAIMGPALVRTGLATGIPDPDHPEFVNYGSLTITKETATTNQVSPRYWLLFVGIFVVRLVFHCSTCHVYLPVTSTDVGFHIRRTCLHFRADAMENVAGSKSRRCPLRYDRRSHSIQGSGLMEALRSSDGYHGPCQLCGRC